MGILDRVRGKIREMREQEKMAREAERKLRLAEEKQEASKYVKKAKSAGIELTEEEALALVRKKKRKNGGGALEKLRRAGEVADTFAKEFAEDLCQRESGKSRTKCNGRSRRQKQKKSKPAIQEINGILVEFSEFLGFGKKGRGKGPFDFWDLL
ncbi:hypothetical protein [Archaeoglobus sp.]